MLPAELAVGLQNTIDIERAVQRLEQKLGRSPLESEIAQEMEMSLSDYQSLLGKVRGTQLVYLEDMAHGEGDGELGHGRHASGGPRGRLG